MFVMDPLVLPEQQAAGLTKDTRRHVVPALEPRVGRPVPLAPRQHGSSLWPGEASEGHRGVTTKAGPLSIDGSLMPITM